MPAKFGPRHQPGTMNATEADYAAHLRLRQLAGEVKAFWFERMKFRIGADTCWYSPDFIVQMADDTIEAHEVKGYMTDDGAVKCKAFADTYPIRLVVVERKSKKAGFTFRTIGNKGSAAE